MSNPTLTIAVSAALVATSGMAAAARSTHYAGEQFAPRARISIAGAERIALAARPGVITDRELEKERGGSGLRYSFDVKSGATVYEVGVDAKTGKVLENDLEGRNPD
ncbi:MAG TPA: PepSY domain-containing protein [Caulobacteraceae bacterium]|jgi:uncharacterized membrane protein YkoI